MCRIIRRLLIISSLISLISFFIPAEAENLMDPVEVHFITGFSNNDLVFSTRMDYDVVEIRDAYLLNVPGQPAIPYVKLNVALPPGMKAEDVRILGLEEETLPGEYLIFPAQEVIPFGRTAAEAHFVPPDARTYESLESFPSQFVELIGQTDLAGQGIAVLRIFPLRYMPVEKRLMLLRSIELIIEGREGYICGDYLPANISEVTHESYKRMVRDMVVNPEDVELRVAFDTLITTDLESGGCGYVIITESSWIADFQPLADWKSKKGIPTLMVDRDWIYNKYDGLDDPEKIRNFIRDAHDTWGATYFLLGGDSSTIPFHTYSSSLGSVPSDTYYGDYDSDWICEVHIGRASVKTVGEIGTFIDKVLTYEKNPPLTDYARRAGLFGFDLYHHDSAEGEACKVDIDNLYIPPDWDVNTVYDRQPGDHKIHVIDEINSGHNLLNLIDHCGWYCMGAGYINHGGLLVQNDVENFSNDTRQSILYVTGCDPCAFDYDDCIAEHFVRNEEGGGVAFIGNSRFGFFSGYDDDYYSSRYDRYFFRSLFEQDHYRLGECFSDHKNDAHESNIYYEYLFHGLTLLGDPELPIWTEDPMSFDIVSYPDSIPLGPQSIIVEVGDNGLPVKGALVCLTKDSEIYAVGRTGSDGSVNLNIYPLSSGFMDITVTKRNYLPYESIFTVSSEFPDFSVTLIPDSTVAVRGEIFGFEVVVTNNSYSTITADFWTDIILWHGEPYPENPVAGPFTAPLEPSETRQGYLYHLIPSYARSGIYQCYGRVGVYPDFIWAEDYFEATVVDP